VSDGITWGLGTTFPSRSAFRALIEWNGEWVINKNTEVAGAPLVATDGSVAPTLSRIYDPTTFKFGGVWQAKNGFLRARRRELQPWYGGPLGGWH
jgi:hypothetical protein